MKLRMPTQSIDTSSGAQIPSSAIGATTSVLMHHPSPSGHIQNIKPPSNIIMGLLSIWQIVSVAVVGGALFGFGIAMPPIYDTLTKDILDCARYSSASSCPVSTGYCVLVNNACTFPHKDLCRVSNTGQPLTYAQCMAVDAGLGGLVSSSDATMPYRYYSSCQWVLNVCTATNEIPSGRLGVIGAMNSMGGLVGASAGSYFLSMFGYRHVVLASGVLTLLSALITHVNPFGFYTMVAMRYVFGLATGVICVVAPTYVDTHTPQILRDVAGCMFQISITLGIVITAILGYIVSGDAYSLVGTATTTGVVGIGSMQWFLAVSTILSELLIVVAFFFIKKGNSEKGPHSSSSHHDTAPSPVQQQSGGGAFLPTTLPPSMASTFWSFESQPVKQAFVTVTVLILVMQFTGINAIMNYAPRIAKSMGVPPMLGNAVVMSWNFVTTLAAVPLASKLPLRKLYLLGLIAASVGCGISSLGSCLTGSHGGVTALTSFISCIGIALFITGFETGMAPAGFVLVQRAYPSHLTGEAMGYYNAGQNLSAFFIVGLFPVLSDLLSGMFYAAMSPATTAVSTDSGSTIAPSSASTTADTALEAATAFASCVLFGVFSIVGVVGWYVLKKRLP